MIKVEEQGIYNLQGRQVVTPGDLHNRVVVEGEIVQEHSFGGMWLQNVRFYNCTLIKCAFKETFLKKVEFRGCSIICCDFNQATLVECSFVGCSVFRTKMQHARQKSMLILGGRLLQSDFNNSAFEGAQVSSASFKHCRFEQSVWSGRWEGCAFWQADLYATEFTAGTQVRDCVLSYADLAVIGITTSRFRNCNFYEALLGWEEPWSGEFCNCDFRGTGWAGPEEMLEGMELFAPDQVVFDGHCCWGEG